MSRYDPPLSRVHVSPPPRRHETGGDGLGGLVLLHSPIYRHVRRPIPMTGWPLRQAEVVSVVVEQPLDAGMVLGTEFCLMVDRLGGLDACEIPNRPPGGKRFWPTQYSRDFIQRHGRGVAPSNHQVTLACLRPTHVRRGENSRLDHVAFR